MKPIVMLSYGAYSDYRVIGIFNWLSTQQPSELLKEWLSKHPEEEDHLQADKFVAWLSKSGVIEDIEFTDWYLGEYGHTNIGEVPNIALKE